MARSVNRPLELPRISDKAVSCIVLEAPLEEAKDRFLVATAMPETYGELLLGHAILSAIHLTILLRPPSMKVIEGAASYAGIARLPLVRMRSVLLTALSRTTATITLFDGDPTPIFARCLTTGPVLHEKINLLPFAFVFRLTDV